MPYDHAELARQIQLSLAEARNAAVSRADATEAAVDLYTDTSHADWVGGVESVQTKRLVAVPDSPLHEFVKAEPAGDDYVVAATDSSFIAPDKHRGLYCYMINVGRVLLQYGAEESSAELDAMAEHFADPLIEGDEALMGGRLLQAQCAVQELRELRRWSAEYTADAALLDGSLMQLWLALTPIPELQKVWREYTDLLQRFETLGVPVVGYVSKPASQMVLHSERILACADYKVGKIPTPCERRCQNEACSGLWTLDDSRLFDNLLAYGERSPVFRIHNSQEGREHGGMLSQFGFCYIATRHEIARLEFPLWVVERGMLDRLHSMILRQCDLGDGYPLALTLAHNYAVLRNEDRESYFFLLERAGLIEPASEKALGKRATGNRI